MARVTTSITKQVDALLKAVEELGLRVVARPEAPKRP